MIPPDKRCHPLTGLHGKRQSQIRTGGSTGKVGFFGLTRDEGKSWHYGVDYLAEMGDPVYAAHDGVVTRDGEQARGKGYGYRVYLEGSETQTRYAHLCGQTVTMGQRVRAGLLIGWVGKSGNSGALIPTHLHFEVRQENPKTNTYEPVDPEKWFSGK